MKLKQQQKNPTLVTFFDSHGDHFNSTVFIRFSSNSTQCNTLKSQLKNMNPKNNLSASERSKAESEKHKNYSMKPIR